MVIDKYHSDRWAFLKYKRNQSQDKVPSVFIMRFSQKVEGIPSGPKTGFGQQIVLTYHRVSTSHEIHSGR